MVIIWPNEDQSKIQFDILQCPNSNFAWRLLWCKASWSRLQPWLSPAMIKGELLLQTRYFSHGLIFFVVLVGKCGPTHSQRRHSNMLANCGYKANKMCFPFWLYIRRYEDSNAMSHSSSQKCLSDNAQVVYTVNITATESLPQCWVAIVYDVTAKLFDLAESIQCIKAFKTKL